MAKTRVYLVFGGRSGEHEVSLLSAKNIYEAIDRERFEVVPIGITKEGQWLSLPDAHKALTEGLEQAGGQPLRLLADPANPVEQGVFFPVLHGTYGEDGAIQGFFEMAGLPYVGSGVLASAVGMDKVMAKRIFEQQGIAVVPYLQVMRYQWQQGPREPIIEQIEERLGYPCFVKPVNAGSSVGVSKAKDRADLLAAIDLACRYDRKVLVEEAINGREIEVAVLGNDEPLASVPGEVVPSKEFYDYEAKYLDEGSKTLVPAPIDPAKAEEARELALAAFRALDCAGLARVDFFLERETNKLYLNEVNTLPGFTSISMYPMLWQASGLSYQELITRLIELALERHRDKAKNETSR